MKHWQEKRNYQHVRDEAANVRSNIITVDGIDVEVSDEVYLAYTQLDRRERYLMEEVETDKKLSLDRLLKSGVPLEKLGMEKSPSAEDIVLQNEAWQQQEQLLSQLSEALSSLTEEEWQMIQALYWEGVSAREYARRLGVYHRTVLYWRDKVLEKLRQKF